MPAPFSRGNDVIAGRYKVIEEAGRGNFAQVVRARDMQTGEVVAVKILQPQYARDAQFEQDVLQAVTNKDTKWKFKVCKLISQFKVDGCTCFVFPVLGSSLKKRRGSELKTIATLMKQISRALQFLHFECRMIHTDLKPENILLDSDDTAKGKYSLGQGWTIVDLGSASFYTDRQDADLISTRPYRAPEVVLGCGWSYAADMWSLGCILYELFTGRTLFETSNDSQHLLLMERRLGAIPRWLQETADQKARMQFFESDGSLRGSTGSFQPFLEELRDPELVDLLRKLLQFDPVVRIRADEVCHHPFILRNASSVEGETPILTKLPPSAYSSGLIRCPGGAQFHGQHRDRVDTVLPPERTSRHQPSRHQAPPAPATRGHQLVEDSRRAISAADGALYGGIRQHRPYAQPMYHHHPRLY